MKSFRWTVVAVGSTFLALAFGTSVSAVEPIPDILDAKAEINKVRSDFQFTEGPTADHQGNLYFSDIPANLIYQLNKAGEVSVFLEPSNHANGLMYDGAGGIVACEMDGRVVRIDIASKEVKPLASQYNGKRFNAPNDLALDCKDGVYFTDPHFRAPMPLPQGVTAVYYVNADGEVTRLIEDLKAPNGVILSPDEKTLYVIPTLQKQMMAYPIESPGKLGPGRTFCELQQAEGKDNTGGDGLDIDSRGNLYITSGLGIQVFNPQGKPLGIVPFPEQPSNCAFGGPERQTLFVTARTSLYAVNTQSQGIETWKGRPGN